MNKKKQLHLTLVTYNVSCGVMTEDPGWEVDVVRPCQRKYNLKPKNGLSACAKAGIELLASAGPEIICLQEIPADHRYIQQYTDHDNSEKFCVCRATHRQLEDSGTMGF